MIMGHMSSFVSAARFKITGSRAAVLTPVYACGLLASIGPPSRQQLRLVLSVEACGVVAQHCGQPASCMATLRRRCVVINFMRHSILRTQCVWLIMQPSLASIDASIPLASDYTVDVATNGTATNGYYNTWWIWVVISSCTARCGVGDSR